MDDTAAAPQLPAREAQILELLAEGLTNEQIAERIGTSTKTVSNQIATLYMRIGVDNRVQAARWHWDRKQAAA